MQGIKTLIIDAWRKAWDCGDVDALDAITHPDYRRVSASTEATSTLADLKRDILEIRDAFPDLVTTVDTIVMEGDDAALFWNAEGTFASDLGNVPATGRRVSTRGSNQLLLRDGLIVSERVTWDHTELLSDGGVPSLRSAFEPESEDVVVDDLSGSIDLDLIKGFNRQFITGVTVVTTTDSQGKPRGLAVNSYASVSLEPPLVMVCVQKSASTHSPLFRSSHLGINILSNQQGDTVRTFASKSPDKFADLGWHAGPHGTPLIDGSAASIEAEIKERFQAKTHTVFIAKVTHAELADVAPMIYKAGRFFDGEVLTEI